ncbi:uncharacterized protein LOC111095785 isoform X2 [Canis lupus familiaris]|uniref:uncharacterized protein LOC111095785 isoform X2 n=1 Tax=Canis lupus familiaris TaxID=9615 RepID=UPI0018F7DE51|nr:uncharacterized protein LOC111095785 isoform X2 [Canis lupus familiaris]
MPASTPGARALIPAVCTHPPPTPSPKVQNQAPLASFLFPGPLAEGGPPDSFTFRFFPQIRSLMLFPAGGKLIGGGVGCWGGGEFTRAGDNLEPTALEDLDSDRSKPTIKKKKKKKKERKKEKKKASNGSFSTGALGCRRGLGAVSEGPRRRGRGPGSPRIVSSRAPPGQRVPALRSWRAPGARPGPGPAAPRATYPRRLGADPRRFTWTRRPGSRRPARAPPGSATQRPKKPQHVASTLVSRSPGRSTQDRRTDSDCAPTVSPRGYLVHALQTTLWTFSVLFKSPPGEGGKKKSRGDPNQLERKKKKFKRVSTAAKKAQTLPTFKRQQGFQEGAGRPLPTRTWPETRHPQPHCPSFRQKGFQLHHREAPFLVLGKH